MQLILPFLGMATAASAASILIAVGQDGLKFIPESVTAEVGDTLEFRFYPGDHSVVSSTFDEPCVPNSPAFFSGYVPGDPSGSVTFVTTVNTTDPIWFYCSLRKHCELGMVGVINPPCDEALAAYKSKAASVAVASAPVVIQGGCLIDIPSETPNSGGRRRGNSVESPLKGTLEKCLS
ncbi:hypothetical protein B7494_g1491 [Chlorociboria aeruginascens]|nr:hypothetical protein B7494_g1491 [Chlorociboria aeruginascens]